MNVAAVVPVLGDVVVDADAETGEEVEADVGRPGRPAGDGPVLVHAVSTTAVRQASAARRRDQARVTHSTVAAPGVLRSRRLLAGLDPS
ncbi:MAG TPA: hypothetical protein VFL94_08215 [Actinomycetales bacterium]|nr:hypothetical protein [Actinomycetales bacterium]